MLKSTLAVALLLALLQLAYWLGVRRYFDGLAAAVAPVAEFDYQRVVAWPNGSLGIDGLSFAPAGADQRAITVERLRVERGDLAWLVRWLAGVPTTLPERLGVRLEGVRVGATLLRQLRRRSALIGLVVPFEGVACGGENALSDADYAALGWTDQRADVLLQLDYARDRRRLRLSIHLDRAPLGTLRATLDLLDVPDAGLPLNADLGGARLDRVELVYEEHGALAQRNRYCAQSAGGATEAAWLEQHLKRLHERLREEGLVPDEPIWSAYVHWLASGGRLRLTAAPAPGVPLADYRAFAPEDRLRLLGLTMHLNGDTSVPVEASGIAARGSAARGSAFKALPPLPEPPPADERETDFDETFIDAENDDVEPVAEAPPQPTASAPARSRVVVVAQTIDFADLDTYRGQRVRIATVNGNRHSGIVIAATADAVELEIRRYGGGARLPIPREQINRIEVLRRELRSDG